VTNRIVTTRKTTLEEADDARRDREFWAGVPALERLLCVFSMSEEAYAFVGKLPVTAADGRSRFVARVLRP